MVLSKLALVAGTLAALAMPTSAGAVDNSPLATAAAASVASDVDECRLPPVLDPSADGLPSSDQLWGNRWALRRQVERHQAVVRVPSVSHDDLGPIGKDPRWQSFDELHRVLRRTYPALHNYAQVERVNTYGLVYTIRGSDPALKPLLLTAHQDVVPVNDYDEWTEEPFGGRFDGTYLWGRGANDDKNGLTALLSVVEVMLTQVPWRPHRTLVLATGFDEGSGGYRGAGRIAEMLVSRYGENGFSMLVDEGGFGAELFGDDVVYGMVGVAEKGHVDVRFEVTTPGGHGALPPPHTGVGIASEMVVALEDSTWEAQLTRDGPVWAHMACLARHSPDALPEVTRLVRAGDADGLAAYLGAGGLADRPAAPFTVRTSQAVDVLCGGSRVTALPERVSLGVDYRVIPEDGIATALVRIVGFAEPIAAKHNLSLFAFEDEGLRKYHPGVARVQGAGKISIRAARVVEPGPVSPMTGKAWDTFAGSLRHTLRFDGTVVPVGEMMVGNTDTRHYQDLTPNIYRFTPAPAASRAAAQTANERVDMREHMKLLAFYYDLIRNFDRVVLDDERPRGRRPWSAEEDNEEL